MNRTSGEVARTIDGDQVRDMALNGRNYMQLASIIPGAALLNDDSLDLTTSLSTAGQAINGARPNSTSLNIDGGNNLDSGSNGSQINNVGIDFIQEVKIQTSNFSAEYGRQSGSSVNVVTQERHQPLFGQRLRVLPSRWAWTARTTSHRPAPTARRSSSVCAFTTTAARLADRS